MNKKRLIAIIGIMFSFLLLTGCKTQSTSPSTPASILIEDFEKIIKDEQDISIVAQTLSTNEIIKTKMITNEVTTEDFLSGFENKITNFKKGYVMQPMIGSIPFIAYVFESDNPSELEEELRENANPRWNICVEADETMTKVVGNYVFFVMSPLDFEE